MDSKYICEIYVYEQYESRQSPFLTASDCWEYKLLIYEIGLRLIVTTIDFFIKNSKINGNLLLIENSLTPVN